MTHDPMPDPKTLNDEASFVAFVRDLEADRRLAARGEVDDLHGCDAARGWQSSTIEQFLESALGWAEASRFGRSQWLAGDSSAWRRLAVFLHAGKGYE